jgi:flagellar FliL protein
MAEGKEEVNDAKENQALKKSKLKWIIIITLIVLLVGAGGFFGYSMFKKNTKIKAATKESQKVSIICPLKSFVVNLLDKRGVERRYLKVTIEVEVVNAADKQLIESNDPQLRDSVLLLLSDQTLNEINTMEGKLALKQELLSRMKQILGEGVVRRIFFTEFVVQ